MRSVSLLIGVVAAVVGAIVVIDLQAPSTATSQPAPVAAGPAVGGAWYCAAGAAGENDQLTITAAAPATSRDPGDLEVTVLDDGAASIVAARSVFPGSARQVDVGAETTGAAIGAGVRWWDEPVVGSRVWRRQVTEGVSGIVSGPCTSTPSPTWYVPGLSTADGGTARLHLANPFSTDASVTVEFTTPTGPEEPIRLQNVSVPSESVEVVVLNEHVPRQADLGVTVQTRSGRVVVEAVQELDAAIGGIEARSLVRAAPELSETWTMPWSLTDPSEDEATPEPTDEPGEATDAPADSAPVTTTPSPGNGTASWIWVSNPGPDAAAVTLTLHTEDGPFVPDIGDELVVDGGRIVRIDLRGALPPGLSAAGATLRSENGVPVAAAASTLYEPESGDPGETGYTSQLGWPGPDPSWVVPGEAADGRAQVLHVVNPGGADAVVDVALWNGSVLTPDAVTDLTIPAGALVELDLTEQLADASHSVAHVTASEGSVVVGRHSVSDDGGPDEWIAHTGVPSGLWSGGDTVPSVRYAPRLLQQLGTSGGLPVPVEGEPAPTSEPVPPTSTPTSTPTPDPTSSPTG